MQVFHSVKSAKSRHAGCQMVRRKGKLIIINKQDPKFKARMACKPNNPKKR